MRLSLRLEAGLDMTVGVLNDLVFVWSWTGHRLLGGTSLAVRLHHHLGHPLTVLGSRDWEPDLGQIIEVQSVLRRRLGRQVVRGSSSAGTEIVVVVLLALVVVKVVSVDLLGERHSGEVTEQLIDRPVNTILFSKVCHGVIS